MMSHRALSQLHVTPPKLVINGDYYRENILDKDCLDAIHRTAETGGVLRRSLMTDTGRAVFMQDGAPPHTARKHNSGAASTCPLLGAWRKARQQPDLKPIENPCAIVQQVDMMTPATSASELAEQLKKTWGRIKPDVLDGEPGGRDAPSYA